MWLSLEAAPESSSDHIPRTTLGRSQCVCVSLIYKAGQKDSQVHNYNENLQSTFFKMLKCNFAMFSIWQASTWQTGVLPPIHIGENTTKWTHPIVKP